MWRERWASSATKSFIAKHIGGGAIDSLAPSCEALLANRRAALVRDNQSLRFKLGAELKSHPAGYLLEQATQCFPILGFRRLVGISAITPISV